MGNENRFKMSQERLDAIKEELNYLETVREKEVAELIKEIDKKVYNALKDYLTEEEKSWLYSIKEAI